MDHSSMSSKAKTTVVPRGTTGTQLHRGWRAPALSATTILIMLSLSLFLASIPERLAQLQAMATVLQHPLQQLNLSESLLVGYLSVLDCAMLFLCCVTSGLILRHKSSDWPGLLIALQLVIYGVSVTRPLDALFAAPPMLRITFNCLLAIGQISVVLCAYLFPGGRFIPRWTRPLTLLWIALTLLWLFFPSMPFNMSGGTLTNISLPVILVLLAWFTTVLYSQAYRFRRVSSAVQRQQIKWVAFGVGLALLGLLTSMLPGSLSFGLNDPGLARVFYLIVGTPVCYILALWLPCSLACALLRYRLWDIDARINRALVYTLLLTALILIYLASNAILPYPLRVLTDRPATLSIVIATLIAATLFQPLRRSIQAIIDRLLYRKKYEAARALAALAMALGEEINLAQLNEQILKMVEETMDPMFVSLWLKGSIPAEDQAEKVKMEQDEMQRATERSFPIREMREQHIEQHDPYS